MAQANASAATEPAAWTPARCRSAACAASQVVPISAAVSASAGRGPCHVGLEARDLCIGDGQCQHRHGGDSAAQRSGLGARRSSHIPAAARKAGDDGGGAQQRRLPRAPCARATLAWTTPSRFGDRLAVGCHSGRAHNSRTSRKQQRCKPGKPIEPRLDGALRDRQRHQQQHARARHRALDTASSTRPAAPSAANGTQHSRRPTAYSNAAPGISPREAPPRPARNSSRPRVGRGRHGRAATAPRPRRPRSRPSRARSRRCRRTTPAAAATPQQIKKTARHRMASVGTSGRRHEGAGDAPPPRSTWPNAVTPSRSAPRQPAARTPEQAGRCRKMVRRHRRRQQHRGAAGRQPRRRLVAAERPAASGAG